MGAVGSVGVVVDAPVLDEDAGFPGGTGRVGNTSDFDQIIRSVTAKLFDRLGDDCLVYPGHGDDTTIGTERPHLPGGARTGLVAQMGAQGLGE